MPETLASSSGASPWINVTADQICGVHTNVVRSCRTLVANRWVRVFRATDRTGYDIAFGEWRPTRRLTELELGPPGRTTIRVKGEWLAYAVSNPHEAASAMVSLLRMREGEGAGWIAADGIEVGSPGVTDLALTRSGIVAWIVEGRFVFVPNWADERPTGVSLSRAVFAVPGPGDEPVLLAAGSLIQPRSLVAAHGRIYWRQDGSTRTFATP
ncbi:MAG: hypothetical protein E6G34_10350 [Actinobacteria bacterium]|nr:MAG: hypothetical protein E6G34_10350 [Actinomycetota bacterium]